MPNLILCYHKVGSEKDEGRFLNVAPETLRRHIQFFRRRRFNILPLASANFSTGDRQLILTFDDAYQSAVSNGVPVLASCGVKATFFAVPGHDTSAWDGPERARPLATMQTLRELQADGHEIGNHTLRHPHLAGLGRRLILEELVSAQHILENNGLSVQTVCYPYGSVDAQTVRIVRRLGFHYGVSLRKGMVQPGDDPLTLPRVVAGFRDSNALLLYKVWLRPKLQRMGV